MTEAIAGPHKSFEDIKHIDENGIEYWTARELHPLLGYSRWESFDEVIARAAKAALQSGQIIDNHFRQLTKMVDSIPQSWVHFMRKNSESLTSALRKF